MKQHFSLVAILVLLAGLFRVSAAPADLQKLAAANNVFAFNLLKQLAKEQPESNIFISPYSAATALQMVVNGAAGQTKMEIQQALAISGMSIEELDEMTRAAADSLGSNQTNVVLTTANSIWYRQGDLMNSSFTDANKRFFQATVKPLDFHNPPAAEAEINQWASDQTHGRIKGIADGIIDQSTAMVLANAVYFKGKWLDTFDKSQTKQRSFHLAAGANKKVPMMEMSLRFAYHESSDCKVVRLPYKGGKLAMYVFLPDRSMGLAKFLHVINGDNWQRKGIPGYESPYAGYGFGTSLGRVVLPKFKFADALQLGVPLKAMGIKSAFDPGKADFSGMFSGQLWLSEVRQKTFVEVDEEGTEAAVVTAERGTYGAYEKPPKPFQMIVDRPFLFLIEDSQTGIILFMGAMFDPSTN